MALKAAQLTELKSMASPPVSVIRTAEAMLILMGYPLQSAQDWKTCKKFLGQSDALKSLAQLDASQVTPLQASKAKEKLAALSVEKVRGVSAAAAGLYAWVMEVIEKAESGDGREDKATPK